MKKPVFTFVIPHLSGGGAERVVSVLASELAEMGYETHVIVHYKTEGEYPISEKVDVVYDAESEENKNDLNGKIKKIIRIRHNILSWNTNYVIPFLDSSIIHTYICTRFTKIKFIATIRVNPRLRTSKWRAKICDYIANRSNALFAQTEDEKIYYPIKVQKKTFVLPNPVNSKMLEEEHTYRKNLRIIVAAGRLTNQKNYPMLIDAIGMLKNKYPDIEAHIYGVGELEKVIRKYIQDNNLSNNVIMEGRSNSMGKVLANADIYIMTSDFEGMPNALMEGMAVGLPCISTDCPSGPADLITQAKNGILVPVNDVASLAEAIAQLIENPDYAEKLGRKARETLAKGYTPKIIAERFVKECLKY